MPENLRSPERCFAVLVKAADDSAERGKKRSDYRYIAKYLKWMMRYPGGRERAETLAETYRKQYPRRSAMLDELRGIWRINIDYKRLGAAKDSEHSGR